MREHLERTGHANAPAPYVLRKKKRIRERAEKKEKLISCLCLSSTEEAHGVPITRKDSLAVISVHVQEKKDRKRKLKALKAAPHVSQYKTDREKRNTRDKCTCRYFLVRVTNLCVERKFWRALRRLLKTHLLALPAVPQLLAQLRAQNRVVRERLMMRCGEN